MCQGTGLSLAPCAPAPWEGPCAWAASAALKASRQGIHLDMPSSAPGCAAWVLPRPLTVVPGPSFPHAKWLGIGLVSGPSFSSRSAAGIYLLLSGTRHYAKSPSPASYHPLVSPSSYFLVSAGWSRPITSDCPSQVWGL